jgi:hypothetical protein
MRVRDPRLLVVVSAALLGATVAFPMGVIASHQFTDVPTSHTFHGDVAAIKNVGVTVGCAPTKYCPEDFVTRGEMAAFLNRLGALAPGKNPVVNATKVDGLDSSQFLRADVPFTDRATCAGVNMMPAFLPIESVAVGGRRYLGTGAGLTCGLQLPNGATITAFAGRLSDTASDNQVSCSLRRYHKSDMLTAATLASFGSSLAFSGGLFFRNETSITDPVVDNELYAYVVNCSTGKGGNSQQIAHVDVVYSWTGTPGL